MEIQMLAQFLLADFAMLACSATLAPVPKAEATTKSKSIAQKDKKLWALPPELLKIIMLNMSNASDLHAFQVAYPPAAETFVDVIGAKDQQRILKAVLSRTFNIFALQTMKQNICLDQPLSVHNQRRSLNPRPTPDIFEMSHEELQSLNDPALRYDPLIRCGMEYLVDVDPADWRFPWGRDGFNYGPATLEVSYPDGADALYRALLSSCLHLELATRMKAVATDIDAHVAAVWRELLGMPWAARVRTMSRNFDQDLKAKRRYTKYVLQLTDLGVLGHVFKWIHQEARNSGGQLPDSLSHLPAWMCQQLITPKTLALYEIGTRNEILRKAANAPEKLFLEATKRYCYLVQDIEGFSPMIPAALFAL